MSGSYNILITGASRGIGHAITKSVSQYAKNMYLTSFDNASLENGIADIRSSFSGAIHLFNLDQSTGEKAARELAIWLRSVTNSIDIIILCAGNYFEGPLCEIENGLFENSLNTNFIFNYYAAKYLVPLMENSTYGRIVIIGSTAAYSSYPVPSYSVAKWALRGLAVNLRQELSTKQIGVTFVAPGPVLTDMWSDVEVPAGRILAPEDIASIVCNVLDLSPQAVVDEIIVRPMLGDYYG